jgi:hypothetical protein
MSLPLPPVAASPWTGIDWRVLTSDDPLGLVRSIVRWRGGFVALGFDLTDPTDPTPIWTSPDGASWQLLPVGTGTTFWPGVQVVAIAEVPGGLVALTSPGSDCAGYDLCEWFGPPVMAWTSTDARTWTPRPLPTLGTSQTWRGAALASGPTGLVAVSLGKYAEVATSADGVAWQTTPPGSLPTGVAYGVLQGTPTGYVLAGTTASSGPSDDPRDPGLLWSADGRVWRPAPVASGAGEPDAAVAGPALRTLAAGRDGLVALLASVGSPMVEGWWSSADGRSWQPTPGPAGGAGAVGSNTSSEAVGAASDAAGLFLLAGDGERIVAVRDGPGEGTRVSTDGRTWSTLDSRGTPPVGRLNRLLVLPGGVLVSNGATTWYGTASTR